ncbi:iron ABC transporter substrate-binding protein [Bacteroidia bacterium]|nr:iron ABC transporter substrate-binding protein [Bacteroidia bacterium]
MKINMFKRNYIAGIIVCLFFSCNTKKTEKVGFEIRYFDNYKEVIVNNPWTNAEEHYFLVADKNVEAPEGGQKILIPLQSLAATSCTHFEFLYLLGEGQTITGICSPELVYNADIRKRYAAGEIKNLGDAIDMNFENTLLLHPDAVMVSGYSQNNEKEKRIAQAGIPIIYNNEWRETTLLKRAEWIKFVAAFYNKEREADSIFNVIEQHYNAVSQKAKAVQGKPTILSGANFKGTWYMSGGQSYMGQLFADAGADYFYKDDDTRESLPLSFEMVLQNFQNADVWVGAFADSKQELINSDERYALFSAVKNNQVYNVKKRTTSSGGNDFWEGAIAHPDLILSDLIKILHPELLPDYELVYMKKLE